MSDSVDKSVSSETSTVREMREMLNESALSALNRSLRSAALRCDCAKDDACDEHSLYSTTRGIAVIVEDAIYVQLAQYVTPHVKTSWLRLIASCCPVSPESQEKVFRRLCRLKSEMDNDALTVHNRALKGESTPFGAKHREDTCKWCIAPKEALNTLLSGN